MQSNTSGAAAIAAPQTLTSSEIEQANLHLQQTQDGVIGAIKRLSEAQWKFKPAPDRWSIAEVDEHLALMRSAWRNGISAHEGRFYSHVQAGFGPQPPGAGSTIPIIIGGHGDAALRRAARYGDGWAVSAKGDALLSHGLGAVAERLERMGAAPYRYQSRLSAWRRWDCLPGANTGQSVRTPIS